MILEGPQTQNHVEQCPFSFTVGINRRFPTELVWYNRERTNIAIS